MFEVAPIVISGQSITPRESGSGNYTTIQVLNKIKIAVRISSRIGVASYIAKYDESVFNVAMLKLWRN